MCGTLGSTSFGECADDIDQGRDLLSIDDEDDVENADANIEKLEMPPDVAKITFYRCDWFLSPGIKARMSNGRFTEYTSRIQNHSRISALV
ncbi:hypothetical protein DPMN_101133 [Dreissena polymorpha]|uniref:Uncharacterized protein n=1 Tax=Dreissena polymorpha TaxID=45954 RepID=A0A9D4R8U5_DREPO|nr:hypothetical protein DPMN_101133 [Dreissena polymorpha]